MKETEDEKNKVNSNGKNDEILKVIEKFITYFEKEDKEARA